MESVRRLEYMLGGRKLTDLSKSTTLLWVNEKKVKLSWMSWTGGKTYLTLKGVDQRLSNEKLLDGVPWACCRAASFQVEPVCGEVVTTYSPSAVKCEWKYPASDSAVMAEPQPESMQSLVPHNYYPCDVSESQPDEESGKYVTVNQKLFDCMLVAVHLPMSQCCSGPSCTPLHMESVRRLEYMLGGTFEWLESFRCCDNTQLLFFHFDRTYRTWPPFCMNCVDQRLSNEKLLDGVPWACCRAASFQVEPVCGEVVTTYSPSAVKCEWKYPASDSAVMAEPQPESMQSLVPHNYYPCDVSESQPDEESGKYVTVNQKLFDCMLVAVHLPMSQCCSGPSCTPLHMESVRRLEYMLGGTFEWLESFRCCDNTQLLFFHFDRTYRTWPPFCMNCVDQRLSNEKLLDGVPWACCRAASFQVEPVCGEVVTTYSPSAVKCEWKYPASDSAVMAEPQPESMQSLVPHNYYPCDVSESQPDEKCSYPALPTMATSLDDCTMVPMVATQIYQDPDEKAGSYNADAYVLVPFEPRQDVFWNQELHQHPSGTIGEAGAFIEGEASNELLSKRDIRDPSSSPPEAIPVVAAAAGGEAGNRKPMPSENLKKTFQMLLGKPKFESRGTVPLKVAVKRTWADKYKHLLEKCVP
ncbi:unnamed protein product [Notodromas monacha]|uniref:Uncharacterized protein n=1 Tax=Notodromas monacha TaxID=399045 RepID=A0A7R9BYN0_9CRUS|nr:unnamed protein product [Notodromas monacha]CAG0922849.1 unnamed protein product [Notodromas monacha]